HVARGGSAVTHCAAQTLQPRVSAWHVFGPVLLLAGGILPSQIGDARAVRLPLEASLLAASAALVLLAYSVMHWAWPPVGFEASGLVWWFSNAAAAICFVAAVAVWALRAWRSRQARAHGREHVV